MNEKPVQRGSQSMSLKRSYVQTKWSATPCDCGIYTYGNGHLEHGNNYFLHEKLKRNKARGCNLWQKQLYFNTEWKHTAMYKASTIRLPHTWRWCCNDRCSNIPRQSLKRNMFIHKWTHFFHSFLINFLNKINYLQVLINFKFQNENQGNLHKHKFQVAHTPTKKSAHTYPGRHANTWTHTNTHGWTKCIWFSTKHLNTCQMLWSTSFQRYSGLIRSIRGIPTKAVPLKNQVQKQFSQNIHRYRKCPTNVTLRLPCIFASMTIFLALCRWTQYSHNQAISVTSMYTSPPLFSPPLTPPFCNTSIPKHTHWNYISTLLSLSTAIQTQQPEEVGVSGWGSGEVAGKSIYTQIQHTLSTDQSSCSKLGHFNEAITAHPPPKHFPRSPTFSWTLSSGRVHRHKIIPLATYPINFDPFSLVWMQQPVVLILQSTDTSGMDSVCSVSGQARAMCVEIRRPIPWALPQSQ